MASVIPPALKEQVEQRTGYVIAAERPRGGGGASRQGAEVVLQSPDGAERTCYLAWDARAGDPARLAFFERETAVLGALSGPLASGGVRVAPLVAAFPSHLALLSEFVTGQDRFAQATDPAALAADFVAQLAALHRIDAADPALAPLGDAQEPPSQRIAANIAQWRQDNLAGAADPLLQLALVWLAANIPPDRGPPVLLHGDAGPGNFLFVDNRVEALVDWELSHLGDPMEDLAQIWVRSLIQPFVPIADVFRAYEAAGGVPVDLPRVRFHRLYFQLSFSVASAGQVARGGVTGTALLFGTMHRRVMARSLGELAGIALKAPALPDCPVDPIDRTFEIALADLRDEIVPAAGNQRAAAKAKELARLVKFWRMRLSHGAVYDAAEVADIRALLPAAPSDLPGARRALAAAIDAGSVDFSAALQVCHARTVRETAIMADAMGALSTTWYEPLAI
ncbi:phosphotransferase family protein [Novosphingobium sp. KCTC 2891]|uniref:phosphotransferase family protein n=1 Tax=Novosphingobium sp. KCTC 2891 TaxID=2989730 RepID=UPI0022221110|nr:phosphotransferase family protein [Novosphingobium sp. KCTC 2891]MCW1383668.1 phosphotransferase family protein [Novosphingobium sp. KCTC 2891]